MGVNKVDTTSGEVIMDISDSTVTPETLAEGEKAYNAHGERISGTMPRGGSTEEVMWIEATIDLATMSASYINHTFQEVLEAYTNGKIVKIKATTIKGVSIGEITSFNDSEKTLFGEIMVQADLGNGIKLYYFTMLIFENNTTRIIPYIINTTSLGG